MPVETLSRIPAVIEGGATVRFAASGRYTPAQATLEFLLNNGADAPLVVDADDVDGQFVVTLSAEATGDLTPGEFTWGEKYTLGEDEDAEVTMGPVGITTVVPGLGAEATASFARQMVTKLQGALSKLAATTAQSVTFSGQSFSRASTNEYQAQLTYWEARVIAEEAKAAALRGSKSVGGEIGIQFVRS